MSNAENYGSELHAASYKENKDAAKIDGVLGAAMERAASAPNVLSLSAAPADVAEARRALSVAVAQDPHTRAAIDVSGSVVTWNAVVGIFNSLFLVWQTISLQLPLAAGETFHVEPVFSAIGSAGTALVPFLRRWWPSISNFFPASATTNMLMVGFWLTSVFFVLIPAPDAYAAGFGILDRAPVLWAIPGGIAALLIGFAVSRVLGWKGGLIAFVAVVAATAWKVATGRARAAGRAEAEAAQRRRHDDEVQRGRDAEIAERQRQSREGPGSVRPGDPYVVDRHTGRLPNNGRQ